MSVLSILSHSNPTGSVFSFSVSARFLRLAFRLQLPVADGLSGELLDLALRLLGRTFDALLIHWKSSFAYERGRGGVSHGDAREAWPKPQFACAPTHDPRRTSQESKTQR